MMPAFKSKTLFLVLVGSATLILQTGDNVATNAHEYTGSIADVSTRGFKADRWLGSETRPGFYATRLGHLWDGTSETQLGSMTAPKPDRILLAYAPNISPTQTDAVQALHAFDDAPVEIADDIPTPLPRPSDKTLAEAGMAKKPGIPLVLLSNLPKTAASIKAQEPVPHDTTVARENANVQVASISPEVIQPSAPQNTTVSALNLPYTLQIPSVQTNCFPEQLVNLISQIEVKYGKKVVITSGLRPQNHSRNGSLHVHCAAADIIVPGVTAPQLAGYAKTLPGMGGVGEYCHPNMIHIDIGHHRAWHYGCSSKRKNHKAEDQDA